MDRRINEMTSRLRHLNVLVYQEADGYVAQCLNVDVASEGETEQEALENLREALKLYFDDEAEVDVPPVVRARVTRLTLTGA
jgi:predicted RNase H-like HicB family nuclease